MAGQLAGDAAVAQQGGRAPVHIGWPKARGGSPGQSVGGAGIGVLDDPVAPLTERILMAVRDISSARP